LKADSTTASRALCLRSDRARRQGFAQGADREQRKDLLAKVMRPVRRSHPGISLNEHYEGDGAMIYEHACRNGTEAADRLVASSLDRRRTLREPPLAISAEGETNSPAQGVRASTLKGWQRPALRAPFTQRRPLWLRLRRPGLLPQHGASSAIHEPSGDGVPRRISVSLSVVAGKSQTTTLSALSPLLSWRTVVGCCNAAPRRLDPPAEGCALAAFQPSARNSANDD
jgi:hypothetical protein